MRRCETYLNHFTRLAFLLFAIVGVAALTAGLSIAGAKNPHERPLGNSRVFATFPADPGFPEAIAVNGDRVYVAITFNAFGQGFIHTLPAVAHLSQSSLTLFHQYGPGEGPDSNAFGKSGKLYVVLAGTNQISVLRPDSTEETRYSGPASNPGGALDPLPRANPSAIAFEDKERRMLVTNHAIFMPNPLFFAIFDVFVDDKGDKLATPHIP